MCGILSRILVAMDGLEMSEKALEYALKNHPDASVTVLTVVGEPLYSPAADAPLRATDRIASERTPTPIRIDSSSTSKVAV